MNTEVMSLEKFPTGGVETGETENAKGINERESRPSELNDPVVSGFVDLVEKYMRGESTGYFHHGTLIMDTKKAFEKAGISLDFLQKWIPDWESKLAEATQKRDKERLGHEKGVSIREDSRVPQIKTSETGISPEKKTNLDNAILLVEDRVRRRVVPYDLLDHLEKGDRSYVDRFFPSLGVNDSNRWTKQELFLLWRGVVALKKEKDAAFQKKTAEDMRRMQTENEEMRREEERRRREKRNISDEEIEERASVVAERLFKQREFFHLDEFEDLLRPYFNRGNHKEYPGYSGKDLRKLCVAVRNIYSDLEKKMTSKREKSASEKEKGK